MFHRAEGETWPFSWKEDAKKEFWMHPVLMIAGFIYFMGQCKFNPDFFSTIRLSAILLKSFGFTEMGVWIAKTAETLIPLKIAMKSLEYRH